MVKISVVIPAYNEEETLGRVIESILELFHSDSKLFGSEIIVVNDGSTDRTSEIASKYDVKLIQHEVNMGQGAALKTGIKHATELILTFDGDGNHSATDIPRLLEHINSADMVVGARSTKDSDFLRRIPKFFLFKLANYLSEIDILDLNCGFRVFRKSDATRFFNLLSNKFSFLSTITLAYLCSGLNIKYVSIENRERGGGKSKIHPISDTINFFTLIIRMIVYFNPLRVFVPLSIMLFLLSLFVALYSMFVIGSIMDVATILLFVASVMSGMFGLLADLIVRSRN